MRLHTALYAALSGLLLVALALRTTFLRGRYQIYEGYGNEPSLQRASRAHAVSLEHLLPMLLMLLLLELSGASQARVDAFGIAMIAGRVINVTGFLFFGRGKVRRTGMVITYVCECSLAITLLLRSIA